MIKPRFEKGEVVEIINNFVEHGFEIGQHVRLIKVDRSGQADMAESLDGKESFWVSNDDVKKIRK